MQRPKTETILLIVNGLLLLVLGLLILQFTAKLLLRTGYYAPAARIFALTGPVTGEVIARTENEEREAAEAILLRKKRPFLDGIHSWTQQHYDQASVFFAQAGHDRFLAYTRFKEGNLEATRAEVAKGKNPVLSPYLNLHDGNYEEAARLFLETRNYAGLASLFLKLHNYPTAIYYLYQHGHPHTDYLGALLSGFPDLGPAPAGSGREIKGWYSLLQGDLHLARDAAGFHKDTLLPVTLHLLLEPPHTLDPSLLREDALLPFRPLLAATDPSQTVDSLQARHEKLKVFSVLPQDLEEREIDRNYLTLFGIVLIVLISVTAVALFSLYRKYTFSLVFERQKELEKMDALSLARMQNLEAKRKRDKTELNVSSFVTLNIQLEVLDTAYTKLGLRVDTRKLAEQIEKTKIPNISYKVYTLSNSYGFDVKMQSVEFKELVKMKKHGAVILVLKGDLIALLKSADAQNAYLQFSKKDSRKVPEQALKLSWEGNVITLNKI